LESESVEKIEEEEELIVGRWVASNGNCGSV
jgi:hypothetical protein